MAYTQTDLDRLDAMIASGTLEMTYDGKRVVYRDMNQMLRARAHVASQIAAAGSAAPARFVIPEYQGL